MVNHNLGHVGQLSKKLGRSGILPSDYGPIRGLRPKSLAREIERFGKILRTPRRVASYAGCVGLVGQYQQFLQHRHRASYAQQHPLRGS